MAIEDIAIDNAALALVALGVVRYRDKSVEDMATDIVDIMMPDAYDWRREEVAAELAQVLTKLWGY